MFECEKKMRVFIFSTFSILRFFDSSIQYQTVQVVDVVVDVVVVVDFFILASSVSWFWFACAITLSSASALVLT